MDNLTCLPRPIPARRSLRTPGAARGFTMTEMMITIAILAVLGALAVPAFQRLLASQKVGNGASDLYLSLIKTRSEAIKRNSNVVIAPVSNGTDWGPGWTITDQATSTVIENHGSLGGITATGPTSVVYQGSGRIQGTVTPFSLSSTVSNVTPRCITLNLTGRPTVTAASC